MIAIKNADGTLVPVIDSVSGASRSVALSLVHSHQKRAEILLYELQDGAEHIRDLPQPEPFGKLVLRRLPDNPFGEVEIQADLNIDPDMRLHVSAETGQEKAVKGNFRIPSAGLGMAERMDQMAANDDAADANELQETATDEAVQESSQSLALHDDLFDNTFDDSFFGESATLEPPMDSKFEFESESDAEPEIVPEPEPLMAPDPEPMIPQPLLASQIVPQDDVFINDPEDEDWGFDELVDPAIVDEEIVHPIQPDPSFDLIGEPEPAADDLIAGTELAPDFGPDINPDPDPDFESAPMPDPLAEPGIGPARGRRLLLASVILFSLSLIELAVYFLLNLQIIW